VTDDEGCLMKKKISFVIWYLTFENSDLENRQLNSQVSNNK